MVRQQPLLASSPLLPSPCAVWGSVAKVALGTAPLVLLASARPMLLGPHLPSANPPPLPPAYNHSRRYASNPSPHHPLQSAPTDYCIACSPTSTTAPALTTALPHRGAMKKVAIPRPSFALKGGGSGGSSSDSVFEKDPNFVPPKYLGLSGHRLSGAIGLAAGAGFLMFGYDQGVMGSLFTLYSFRTRFHQINTTDNPELHYAVMQGCMSSDHPPANRESPPHMLTSAA